MLSAESPVATNKSAAIKVNSGTNPDIHAENQRKRRLRFGNIDALPKKEGC